jgi:hypothetical protein
MTFDELVKEVHRLAPKNAECRVEHTQTNRIGYKYSDDGSKEYWMIYMTTQPIIGDIYVRESTLEQALEAFRLELIKKAFQ